MSRDGFQKVLDGIRAISETESGKGRLFERLMKGSFQQDPINAERFDKVWLWQEWVPDFNEAMYRKVADDPLFVCPPRFALTDLGRRWKMS